MARNYLRAILNFRASGAQKYPSEEGNFAKRSLQAFTEQRSW